MKKVISVNPLNDGRVFVKFSDGIAGEFDVKPYMKSAFFSELEDAQYFKEVRLFFSGIGWPRGQDLGPDTIAAELKPATIHLEQRNM